MSLSNPTTKNPATKFLQWRGGVDGGGQLIWYDKENKENVEVEKPFSFIVLDELNTITGFNQKDQSGFWSNEVRDMRSDEFVVKSKSGVVARGLYAQISESIKAKGAKYAKSIYIAFKDESGELVIGNLRVSGAALTAWIEFNKSYDITKCAVILESSKKAKKGATTYFIPVFEGQNMSEATKKTAVVLDQQLQNYLNSYLNRPLASEENIDPEDFEEDDDEVETEEAPKQSKEAVTANGDDDSKKINLSDVPF
jgi:hypothetical protein